MQKLEGKSMDIVGENIEKLRELFPEIFREGKIDFKKLEEELGQFIDPDGERYNFTWAGKTEAKKIAQTPSTGTLRPCPEESKNWDSTQNLYIEGDNLEVLKLLQKSYHKKVKMIYIDPPYNTGKDFVYKDNFHDNIRNYLEITGQVDSEGNKLSANAETNGRYHSDWLSMMYPRLKLARNLLKDDGVIFISIDDNEVANLRKVCDEIFGEDNFIAEIIWLKGKEGGNDNAGMGEHHEYILMFGKTNISKTIINLDEKDTSRHIRELPEQNLVKEGVEIYKEGELFQLINLSKQKDYQLTIPLSDGTTLEWEGYCPQKTLDEYIRVGRVFVGQKKVPYIKSFLDDEKAGSKPSTIFEQSIGTTKSGGIEIKNIFDGKKIFSYPKPSSLIYRLIEIVIKNNEIILDFFSGSSSTAHAVLNYNLLNNNNLKFIMVQLPEKIDIRNAKNEKEKKNTQETIDFLASIDKSPYITEIGKERIRRAGDKIITDNPDKDLSVLDIGFKVLKLDSSNIKAWDSDFDNLAQTLEDSVDNIKSDRSPEDLLYEVLLKYGLDLTLPIEEKSINGSKIYVIGFGALIVCFDNHITLDTVKQIAKLKEEYASETTRVVFKDSSFADTVVKTNALQEFKQHGIDEVVSI